MKPKNPKKLLVFKIIPFESGTTNSRNLGPDICLWQSVCYEIPLRFNISLRAIFSKSKSRRGMKKNNESALMKILQQFGTP